MGPIYGPDGKLSLRGPRRKIVGRVTPGDDVEVSREIERLWEWHTRLQSENHRLSRYIEYLIDLLRNFGLEGLEVDYGAELGLVLNNGAASFPYTEGAVTLTPLGTDGFDTLNVGTYRANYAAGFRLQATVICALSDVDTMGFNINGNSAAYSPSFVPGVGTSTGGVDIQIPWWTMTSEYTGADLDFAEEAVIALEWDTQLALSNGALGAGTMYWRWIQAADATDALALPGADLPTPTDQAVQSALVWSPDDLAWTSATDLDVLARSSVRINSGGTPYERRQINFIEGAGIDLTVADDSINEEVDVTITTDLSEVDILTAGGMTGDGTLFLADDGSWSEAGGGRLNAVMYGVPIVGTSRYVVIPRGAGDADLTFDLERIHVRVETPSSSGSVTVKLQKATGGETAPSWSDVTTVTLTAGEYEAAATIGAVTVTSEDLLRLYFTGIGTGVTDYQAIVTGAKQ